MTVVRARAFTLVEVAVVSAVAGVLVGLLAPAIARSRAVSLRTVCSANLRGLHTALIVYVDGDGRGSFPSVDNPFSIPRVRVDPPSVLAPFETIEVSVSQSQSRRTTIACPTDDCFYPRFGASYEFVPSALYKTRPQGNPRHDPATIRPVTLAYERGDPFHEWVWADLYLAAHRSIAPIGMFGLPPSLQQRRYSGATGVRYDGSVGWYPVPDEPGESACP